MAYTLQQQAFTLSMMANGDGTPNTKGTVAQLEATLSQKISAYLSNPALTALIGQWQVVWGPIVWQNQGSDVADNAMFVGYNSKQNVYVVAVAGTNAASTYDLDVEDLEVSSTVKWSYGGTANISEGTADGLTALLGMTSSQQQTLATFLGSVSNRTSATLIFTGHSLGGALAPALAVALFNSQGGALAKSGWQPSNVYVLPTAGPSVGDQGFVNLFKATISSSSQGFNTLIWNSLDVVPHAWAPQTFSAQTLDNLYASYKLPATSCIQTVVSKVTALPPAQNPYLQLPNTSFPGTFQTPTVPFQDQTCAYLAQLLYQHIYAYFEQLAPELVSGANPIFKPLNPFTAEGRIVVASICQKVESSC
jgi:hypothetical protein